MPQRHNYCFCSVTFGQCNALLDGSAKFLTEKLHTVQNHAGRPVIRFDFVLFSFILYLAVEAEAWNELLQRSADAICVFICQAYVDTDPELGGALNGDPP